MSGTIDGDIAEFTRLHNVLTERFKDYEQRVGRLPPVEVLNEIRYAFRATIELLALRNEKSVGEDEGKQKREAELKARILHALLCAYHDLVDGLVISLPRLLDELREQFPTSSATVAGPRLVEILAHVQEAQRQIADSRGKPEERAGIYKALYDKWFYQLSEDFSFLRAAKLDIAHHHEVAQAEMANQRKQSNLVAWHRFGIQTPLGVLLGLFGREIWEAIKDWW
ncbi:MAG: hypothetical protein OXF68_03035 [Gammaproteobacteria bacterium]|nr:hypothetical protein [Gammaproteobacteria bacterium]